MRSLRPAHELAPALGQDNAAVIAGLKTAPRALVEQLDELVLTTADEAACIDFYTRVLGLKLETSVAGMPPVETRRLRFGRQMIRLQQRAETAAVPGALELRFVAALPLAQIGERLAAENWPIAEGPLRLSGASGPLLALVLHDPDANRVELVQPLDS